MKLASVARRLAVFSAHFMPPLQRLRAARDSLSAERDLLARQLYDAERPQNLAGASKQDRFFHYHSIFDAEALMRKHALLDPQPHPSYLTNFLGVRIDPKFFPEILNGRAGQVEPVPIPANWHADIAEWGAALRAVELSSTEFTVIELGCGWGCWMNNVGVAARRIGRRVSLIGIEADSGHVAFAREACLVNGFDDSQLELHRGVAAVDNGVALFPRQHQAGTSWGLEPVFGADAAERRRAVESGRFDEVPTISLPRILDAKERVDLLHIDIQGGEATLVPACLDSLNTKVGFLLIGTHSREIEGALFTILIDAGWMLEIERPCILSLDGKTPSVVVDGVQGWRNTRLERGASTQIQRGSGLIAST